MDQTEKAFQKQDAIFIGSKRFIGKKSKKAARYFRSVGLSIPTPKEAKESRYVDKKCPFTGNVSIRGKLLRGVVNRCFMKNTITVRRDYLHYITKYRRYEKRHKMISAHCAPCFDVVPGDEVMIGECRPLSKTVRFNVIRVEKKHIEGNVRKTFVMF